MNKFLRAAALVAAALLLLPSRAAALSGIDVSFWQGGVDFAAVAAADVRVVYLRAGEGLSEDSRYRENLAGVRQAGLCFGAYFFVTAADAEEAQAQADFFASLLEGVPYGCRPAVDYEQFGSLSGAEINAVALAFAQRLALRTGVTPLFYTDSSNAAALWDRALSVYPLWVAEYGPEQPSAIGPWADWAGFQYSDAGAVAGISGSVDLDRFTAAVLLDALPFSDVPADAWYASAVRTVAGDGFMEGTADDRFAPGAAATRAMAVTVLWRMAGSPAVADRAPFSDVPADAWYAPAVRWAWASGLTDGCGGGRFAPGAAATREELAAFFRRDARRLGRDSAVSGSLNGFSDANRVAPWALSDVAWAVGAGLLRGTGDGTLAPAQTADRAQLAALTARFLALN